MNNRINKIFKKYQINDNQRDDILEIMDNYANHFNYGDFPESDFNYLNFENSLSEIAADAFIPNTRIKDFLKDIAELGLDNRLYKFLYGEKSLWDKHFNHNY